MKTIFLVIKNNEIVSAHSSRSRAQEVLSKMYLGGPSGTTISIKQVDLEE